MTWFNVTLFDVRYATDSIFCTSPPRLTIADSTYNSPARLNTAIQLGVLIGFVVVAPKFNPTTQDVPAMRAMCTYASLRCNLGGY